MAHTVDFEAKFPSVREEVIHAVSTLADPAYQQTVWGVLNPGGKQYYDDFSQTVHTLYDDSGVLPDPSLSVESILRPSEVDPLRALELVLGPVIDELGDSLDSAYTSHPAWASVVQHAAVALAAMRALNR